MFITKKHLSRRTVLRGMGVTLALPLLDSMVPAQTPLQKTAAAPKTRLACIEMVHGAAGSTGEGTEQALLVARKRRRGFRVQPDAGAAGAVPRLPHRSSAIPICTPPRRGPRPKKAPTISAPARST